MKKAIHTYTVLLVYTLLLCPDSLANTVDFEEQEREEEEVDQLGATFLETYRENHLLPLYYTASPYQEVYVGNTPNVEDINSLEAKFQISIALNIWHKPFGQEDVDLELAYTQLSYWQLYNDSQFFRENNYNPGLFIQKVFSPRWQASLGLEHESNGAGVQQNAPGTASTPTYVTAGKTTTTS